MKRSLLNFIIIVVLALGFNSCKDDDPKEDTSDSFTYDGEKYSIMRGFYLPIGGKATGPGSTHYGWDVVLTSSDIVYDFPDEEFVGVGEVIYMQLFAFNDDSLLPEGDYEYEGGASEGHYVANAETFLNYDFATGEGQSLEAIVDAKVSIAKSNSDETFTIKFTFNFDGGEKITGEYKGMMTEIPDL